MFSPFFMFSWRILKPRFYFLFLLQVTLTACFSSPIVLQSPLADNLLFLLCNGHKLTLSQSHTYYIMYITWTSCIHYSVTIYIIFIIFLYMNSIFKTVFDTKACIESNWTWTGENNFNCVFNDLPVSITG